MPDMPQGSQTMSHDADMRRRARAVIPGGLWGHLDASRLPEGYPQFFARADGCHLVDVDGRRFTDLMCSWGPIVLGHHAPVVEAAAAAQMALGDCMNGPAPVLVDLAELLVDMVPHADWCQFGKNGTDATTNCVTIARAATGRRKVLVAAGAYHGAVPWCSPSVAGVTTEDRAHLLSFNFNDIASLERAVETAGADLAAIVVSAFKHDFGQRQQLPTQEFATPSPRPGRRDRRGTDPRRRARRLPARSRRLVGAARHPAGPVGLEQGDRQRLCAVRRHRARPLPRGRDPGLRHRLVLVRRWCQWPQPSPR